MYGFCCVRISFMCGVCFVCVKDLKSRVSGVEIMAEAPTSPAGGSHESGGEQSPPAGGGVREQDRYLPIANISRIMKKALPANGKIAKDAKDTVQECVSEFISFITSEYYTFSLFLSVLFSEMWFWCFAV